MRALTVVTQGVLLVTVVGLVVSAVRDLLDRWEHRQEESWREVVEIPGDHERLP